MGNEGGRSDGTIDFSGYTTAQLRDLECTIDALGRPLDLARLRTELLRREAESAAGDGGGGAWSVEFTPRSGLAGWLQAKARRLALHGSGSLEIGPAEVLLRGWQRTWLGMPIQADVPVPLREIRNVAQDERSIRFAAGHGRRRRRYQFQVDSADGAERLARLLPATRSAGFEQEWRTLRDFNRHLRAAGSPRVTAILIALNVVVFIAMAIATRRVSGFGLQQLEQWGANNGPLTVGGQWWRLLSAAFLHISPLHLLINMAVLWNIGRLAERLFGRWTYLSLYLTVAVLASLSSIAWNPVLVSAGASGAIFGIFGSFLAYLAKRETRVPRSVIRAHWPTTVAFVLFSLVSGALQTGIDNAAHVGGLLAGLLLGWILAVPLAAAERRAPTPRRILAAAAVVLALGLAGLWEVGGIGSRLTVAQRYFTAHLWYTDGEGRDLALWQRLLAQNQSGLISNDYVGEQFGRRIIPFWQSAYDRLSKEHLPPAQRRLGALVIDFVRLRLAWARAVVALASSDSSQNEQRVKDLSGETTLALARVLRIGMLEMAGRRPPGLVNSPWIERLRDLMLADRWRCVVPPASWGTEPGPHDRRTDLPVTASRVACAAQRDFVHHDFGGLQGMLRARPRLADLPAGGSTYAAAAGGLGNLFEFGGLSMPDVLRLTAEWRRAYPRSPLPSLIEAMAFEEWAWAARGSGYANSVSGAGWFWYAARVEMAADSLSDVPASARRSPLWYQEALAVGIDQAKPLAALRGIFDAGSARFPDYMPLYRQMLRALMPRWFGSYRKVDRFINAQYASSAPRTGFQMYTRLYWMFASLSGDQVDIFTDGDADWGSMRSGFKELVARYPGSDYVLNGFANFACRAGDKREYSLIRPQLATRFSASAWSGEYTLADCDRRLHFAPAPHPGTSARSLPSSSRTE